MEYVIHKASREPLLTGYSGPACEFAGVEPNKVYTDLVEAYEDAKKLTEINPVGFLVSPRPVDYRSTALSINALIDGVWDDPFLKDVGPLFGDMIKNVEMILIHYGVRRPEGGASQNKKETA